MRKRKLKRTAGQRRYQALKRKVAAATSDLIYLQSRMEVADGQQTQLRQMFIMKKLTEAICQLKHQGAE